MSSDPTQPVPEWWQQPQAPKKEQGAQDRDPQDSQATRQYPTSQGSPARPTFTPSQGNQPEQGYPSDQRYQSGQGYPSGPGFPSAPGFQQEQDYPGNQGYQGPPGAPTHPASQGFPAAQGPPARVRRRRRRWPWITLLVIVLVLVGGDRAAKAYAENQMASQVQSSLALSGKPNVTIQGFPFLTQVASRTFKTVDVNASNETGTGRATPDRQPDRDAARDAHPRDQQRHGRPVQRVGPGHVLGAGPRGGYPAGHQAGSRRSEPAQGDRRHPGLQQRCHGQGHPGRQQQDQRQDHRLRRDTGRRPRQPDGFHLQHPEAAGRGEDPEHQRHAAGTPDHRHRSEH